MYSDTTAERAGTPVDTHTRVGSPGTVTHCGSSSPDTGQPSDQQPSPLQPQHSQSRIDQVPPTLSPEEKARETEELMTKAFILIKADDPAESETRKSALVDLGCHPSILALKDRLDELEPREREACIGLMMTAHLGPTAVPTIVLDELDKVVPGDWWARAFDLVCSKGHTDLLRCLLEHFLPVEEDTHGKNYRPKFLNRECGSILHTLGEHGLAKGYQDLNQAFSFQIMDILQSYFSEIQLLTATDLQGARLLTKALCSGHVALVQSMFDWTPSSLKRDAANWEDVRIGPLIHHVCHLGLVALARRLLQEGVDVNTRDFRGRTPLHTVCDHFDAVQYINMVQFLCENGADIQSRNNDGDTPLHLAADNNATLITRCLLSKMHARRDIFVQDNGGRTPLMRARDRKTRNEFAPWKRNDDWHPFPEICENYPTIKTQWIRSVDHVNWHWGRLSWFLYRENDATFSQKLAPDEIKWIHLPANHLEWCDELLTRWYIESDGAIENGVFQAARQHCAHHYNVGCGRSFLPSGMQCFYPDDVCAVDTKSSDEKRGSVGKRICFIAAPFIFSESRSNLKKMERCLQSPASSRPMVDKSNALDDSLYAAYVDESSFCPRRTLNQYAYHNMRAQSRCLGSQASDADMIGSDYRSTGQVQDSDIQSTENLDAATELTVEQLWVWILGEDLVITCFPERWNYDHWPGDKGNFTSFGDLTMFPSTRRPKTASDLALRLMTHVFGVAHAYLPTEPEMQLVKNCDRDLSRIREREGALLEDFTTTYRRLNQGKQLLRASGTQIDHDFQFVETLNDLTSETDLLNELRRVREDLNILTMIHEEQQRVAEAFIQYQRRLHQEDRSILPSLFAAMSATADNFDEVFESLNSSISQGLAEIARLDRKALMISQSLSELLQLKQAHSNAFELSFSRSLSLAAARQSRAVMVFTVVTIVFSPLSFVAAFFTMNLSNLPDIIDLSYVSKYIFGFSFAVAIPCIILAFSMSEGRSLWLRGWDLLQGIQMTQQPGRE